METNTQPELRPDSELRDVVIRLLHRHSERKGYVVRPSDFDPPISLYNIYRIGECLRDMRFIKGSLVSYPDGWWMRISTDGILYAEQQHL